MENSKKQRLVFRINQEAKTHIQEKTETCLEIKDFHRNTNKNQQHSSMDEELFSNGDFDKSSPCSPLYLLSTKNDDVDTDNLDSSSSSSSSHPYTLDPSIRWGCKRRRSIRRSVKKAAKTLLILSNNGVGSRRLLTELPTIDEEETAEALLILSKGDDILVLTSSNLPNNKKKKRVMEVSELRTKKAKTGKENKNWKSKTWLDNHMVKLGFGSDDLSSNEEEGNDYRAGKLDERPIKPKDFEMYLKKVAESYIMHYEKTRMASNEFSEEVVSCMDAMKILTQVELEKKIDVSMPKNKSSVHECNICNMIFPTGQALGGHKRLHWTGPVTKSVVLIEEDEEKDGVEDHCKPLGGHERLHRTVPITESVVLIEEDEEKDGDEDHCKPLGGHERLHWTGPITKSVVLIEEDEEKDRDEDHRKPLMFDLNEPPPLSP